MPYDIMTDYDSIWRTQDEIRTVVNAVLGECIWNLCYSERRMAIELELTVTLDDDAIGDLSEDKITEIFCMADDFCIFYDAMIA